jgi:hypothetical protein
LNSDDRTMSEVINVDGRALRGYVHPSRVSSDAGAARRQYLPTFPLKVEQYGAKASFLLTSEPIG